MGNLCGTLQRTTRFSFFFSNMCAYVHIFPVIRMGDILTKPLYSQLRESDDERVVVIIGGGKHIEVSKYLLLCKVEELLGFMDNCLNDTFWTAGMQSEFSLFRFFPAHAQFILAAF